MRDPKHGRLNDVEAKQNLGGSAAIPRSSTWRPSMTLDGYPSFAEFIARDSDAAIYRRYGHLSARNLLYMQSELYELELELQQLDTEDANKVDNDDAQKTARDWRYYSDEANERSRKHRVLQNKIRIKIKEYRMYLNDVVRTKTRCH